MYQSLYDYPLFLSEFCKTYNFSIDLKPPSNIRFHEDPSSNVRCGQTGTTELIHALRNFANALKNLLKYFNAKVLLQPIIFFCDISSLTYNNLLSSKCQYHEVSTLTKRWLGET